MLQDSLHKQGISATPTMPLYSFIGFTLLFDYLVPIWCSLLFLIFTKYPAHTNVTSDKHYREKTLQNICLGSRLVAKIGQSEPEEDQPSTSRWMPYVSLQYFIIHAFDILLLCFLKPHSLFLEKRAIHWHADIWLRKAACSYNVTFLNTTVFLKGYIKPPIYIYIIINPSTDNPATIHVYFAFESCTAMYYTCDQEISLVT